MGVLIRLWIEGIEGGITALAGTGAALAIYLPLYLLRAVGGGDVKLMAAVGAITGPAVWLLVFVIASLLGGVVALSVTLATSRLSTTLVNIGAIFTDLVHLRRPYLSNPALDVTKTESVRLPHGTVIGAAIWLYLAGAWLG